MVLIESFAPADAAAVATLTLPFELRSRSRLRCRLDDGEEAGLFLPQGTVLRGGQMLLANDGRVIEVRAAAEALYEVRSDQPTQLLRAAYHLGNRHVALEVGDGSLRLLRDHVLKILIEKLGLDACEIDAAFEPEAGAYGGGHHHHGEERGHGGRIHSFLRG
ncbi:MAG: urease accessory protein UreE [Hydrogenophilales bacterium 16-64-46]|nr:MAG: urease accessory protein UreE [Hydrogenophilales bacterium 12-64-13]OYZ05002.1 MAG: urease accessory protein UreE [Hydrogenophilales bacterium 16-64-46]OZA36753.1 MAG: urease accessory protein UreE [Hydrogenophilales bacterium 17-64-34]HQT01105.1 urease accessory protein UreE [Thiobacillus sp.]